MSDRLRLKSDVGAVLSLLLLASTMRWCAAGREFLGNEYEDSYEYVAASWLIPRVDSFANVTFNQVCGLGVARDCELWTTTGHPAGFASLIWAMSRLSPSTPRLRVASTLSFLAAALTVP